MLTITIPEAEYYDDEKQEFVTKERIVLQLEHSLVSLSKWESKYEKPFLDTKDKTNEQVLDYVFMMILTPDVPENILERFAPGDFEQINTYIEAKMTATWFSHEAKTGPSREIITAELIYYWMIAMNIPMECENWHLNRLLTLVRVCNAKNKPPKKMSGPDLAARNRKLNAERKARLGTKG